MKNYYKILGVKKSATDDELKRSYRKLALDYHPDRHGGDDTQFKEVSEAYAVLKDPAKRAEHNLDLKKEELKHKPRNAASHQTTTSADFGGKADPASQQGVWDDVQSNDQAGFRYRYNASPAAPEYLRNAAHWARPVGITLLAMAAVIIVGSYIIRSLSGSGVPTITPLTPSNNSQGNTSPTTDGGGFVNPTPSATPSCPTGQPSINLPQSGIIDNNTSDNQGRESYTVSGSLINDTTATINVNNVGFYFYSGTYDRSAPPDATKAFSDMITDGSVPIPPGVTVNWSATLYVPVSGSRIAASLEYAPGVGDQLTPEWYFTGNISQSCQPSPVSAQ